MKNKLIFSRGDVDSRTSLILMNRWGLILVLLFIRLPKLVGVSQQIWINLLPLTPYWYLILRNEIKANHRLSGSSSIIKGGIKVLLMLDLGFRAPGSPKKQRTAPGAEGFSPRRTVCDHGERTQFKEN